MHFAQAALADSLDEPLAHHGLGRAHQRALYFIARKPALSVSELLQLLGVTKQSLGRVLDDLVARGLVEARQSSTDKRQRLLHPTEAGSDIEAELFKAVRARTANAYAQAGQGSVTGFWRVLEYLLEPEDRAKVAALQTREEPRR